MPSFFFFIIYNTRKRKRIKKKIDKIPRSPISLLSCSLYICTALLFSVGKIYQGYGDCHTKGPATAHFLVSETATAK